MAMIPPNCEGCDRPIYFAPYVACCPLVVGGAFALVAGIVVSAVTGSLDMGIIVLAVGMPLIVLGVSTACMSIFGATFIHGWLVHRQEEREEREEREGRPQCGRTPPPAVTTTADADDGAASVAMDRCADAVGAGACHCALAMVWFQCAFEDECEGGGCDEGCADCC